MSLLEPMVILFLGVVIGGLVVAMYLPIFKLGSVISDRLTVNVVVVAIVTIASLVSTVVRSARSQITSAQHGVPTPRPAAVHGISALLSAPRTRREDGDTPNSREDRMRNLAKVKRKKSEGFYADRAPRRGGDHRHPRRDRDPAVRGVPPAWLSQPAAWRTFATPRPAQEAYFVDHQTYGVGLHGPAGLHEVGSDDA